MSLNEKYRQIADEIIEQLEEDKKCVQKSLNFNLDKISELNICLKSLLDDEEYDTNIFSPRNAENIYSEKIDKYNEEKNKLEEENRNYYIKLNQLNDLLSNMYIFQTNNKIYKVVPKNRNTEYNTFALMEIDRQRIAKDLHDTSLQNLTAIVHKIELASMFINQDPIRAKLELNTISNSIKETINEIRDTIFELRPMTFDDLGFKELLDGYIEKELISNNINIVFDNYSLNIKDQSILIFAFRVIKECLCNALKHSQCDEIRLSIDDSNGEFLLIDIIDNGIGFVIEEKKLEKNKHFGLIITIERVKLMQGTIDIKSSPNNGTEIHIKIPINNIQ